MAWQPVDAINAVAFLYGFFLDGRDANKTVSLSAFKRVRLLRVNTIRSPMFVARAIVNRGPVIGIRGRVQFIKAGGAACKRRISPTNPATNELFFVSDNNRPRKGAKSKKIGR